MLCMGIKKHSPIDNIIGEIEYALECILNQNNLPRKSDENKEDDVIDGQKYVYLSLAAPNFSQKSDKPMVIFHGMASSDEEVQSRIQFIHSKLPKLNISSPIVIELPYHPGTTPFVNISSITSFCPISEHE